MMKINFLKGVKSLATAGVFALLLLFVGSSVSAQSVSPEAVSIASDKSLAGFVDQYGTDYMTKDEFKDVILAEIDAVRNAQETGALNAAEKSVKLTFLTEASAYARSASVSFDSAMLAAYVAAQVRAEDFTVNVNTLAIFEEYYDLFTL